MIMLVMIMLLMIMIRPEADPAVLLAWVETEEDLTAIHNAAKVSIFEMFRYLTYTIFKMLTTLCF